MNKNFILVKAVGTVSSTKTRILNTDFIKQIYLPDEETYVKIDYVADDGKTSTIKVTHTLREMWAKVRGLHV